MNQETRKAVEEAVEEIKSFIMAEARLIPGNEQLWQKYFGIIMELMEHHILSILENNFLSKKKIFSVVVQCLMQSLDVTPEDLVKCLS